MSHPAPSPTPTTPDATEIPFLRHKAMGALEQLTRENALHLACTISHKGRCEWVRRMYRAGTLEVRCLGRFDLHNPIVPELPWPAVAFLVRGEGKSCALLLHIDPERPGEWAVLDADPVVITEEGGRMVLNGRPFCGSPEGPWGVMNGDGPVSPSTPAVTAATQPHTPDPVHPATSPARPAPRASAKGRVPPAGGRGKGSARSPKVEGSPGAPSSGIAGSADHPEHMTPQQEFALRLLRLWQG